MKRLSLLAALALAVVACNPSTLPPDVKHPGEDTAGVGMRLQLVPTDKPAQSASLRTVRSALAAADAGLVAGTYLCTCPPPAEGDTSQTRYCECQVEGAPALPAVCGDGILNVEAGENCDKPDSLGRTWCPAGSHCNMGGEKGWDGVVYPACFNCVPDTQPDAGT